MTRHSCSADLFGGNPATGDCMTTITARACIGNRFTDNGTTVTDNLTGLTWEKKTNDSSARDVGNEYTWSTGAPWAENGTAYYAVFSGFLETLNNSSFAGTNDWRLPTL